MRVLDISVVSAAVILSMTVSAFAFDIDPCGAEEKRYNTSAEAAWGKYQTAEITVAGWYYDSATIPEHVLSAYREIVKEYAMKVWSERPIGQGTLKSWGLAANDPAAKEKFREFIYSAEITPELETALSRTAFRKDYEANIYPDLMAAKEKIRVDLETKKVELGRACEPTVVAQVFRSTVGNLLIMINGNVAASANESGDIALAVRAVSGISITDIWENGSISGGENSELSKLNQAIFGVLEANGLGGSTVVGQIYSAMNPTTWKLEVDTGDTTVAGQVVNTVEKAVDDLGRSDLNPGNWGK